MPGKSEYHLRDGKRVRGGEPIGGGGCGARLWYESLRDEIAGGGDVCIDYCEMKMMSTMCHRECWDARRLSEKNGLLSYRPHLFRTLRCAPLRWRFRQSHAHGNMHAER
jgi:hypothetical protein